MTTIYDPKHPQYLDEADVRAELTRVYDLCHGCRLCFKFCTSFPTLFEMIDRHDDQDAAKLTAAEQDQVVDECFNCKLCYVNCPYTPDMHEWAIDFPRLMLRADAMLVATGKHSARSRLTTAGMARTDLVGKAATTTAALANKVIEAPGGSLVRKVVAKVTGVSATRLLPPYARQRFSTWFRKRSKPAIADPQAKVTVFPTCLVEYQDARVGRDLVRVYEHNRVECDLSDAGCCGAPWLHSGELDKFTEVATANVRRLADEVRRGTDIVVPEPTCSYVLKQDYRDYVGGPDAELVAEHTYDAAEFLVKLHKDEGTSLETEFPGETVSAITYHAPCHLRAQNIGFKSRDLMRLTGAKVKVVQQCSGTDGMFGLKAENEWISVPIAKKLAGEIAKAGGEIVTGDCSLANVAITEQTGSAPSHPLTVMAKAYGLDDDADGGS